MPGTSSAYYNEWEAYPAQWLRNLIDDGLIMPGHVDERDVKLVKAADLAGFTRHHFFAGIAGWDLALQLARWPADLPVWTASLPCFTEDALVLTRRGLIPIPEVVVGDAVLTHRKRWRKVTAIGSRPAETVVLKGQGHYGLETTANHPFLSGIEEWTDAGEMQGKRWANIARVPRGPNRIPDLPINLTRGTGWDKSKGKWWAKGSMNGRTINLGSFDNQLDAMAARREAQIEGRIVTPAIQRIDFHDLHFARFIGLWLGNGWVTGSNIVISCHHDKADAVLAMLAPAGINPTVSRERTATKLILGSVDLAPWLTRQFGKGAKNKSLPAWVFGMREEWLFALRDGYFATDGHKESDGRVTGFTTTSKQLAVGMKIILNQLGKAVSMQRTEPKGGKEIEGRAVNEAPYYRLRHYEHARSYRFEDDYGWGFVRSVEPTGEVKQVYNLAVEEDESYTVDGIAVHNCQPFSTTGKQKGFDDERHLWPVVRDLIEQQAPHVIFGEQVASRPGRAWFDVVQADMEALGYSCAAVDICAASAGAPHQRQRLYWTAVRLADSDGNGRIGQPIHSRELSEETIAQPARGSKAGAAGRAGTGSAAVRGHGEGGVGEPIEQGLEGLTRNERSLNKPGRVNQGAAGLAAKAGDAANFWADCEWVECRDGRWRPLEPGTSPLAPRLPSFVGALSAYGNAIVPPLAAEFIKAVMQYLKIRPEES